MAPVHARVVRWVRYRRALSRMVSEVLDAGYGVSPWTHERLKAQARADAGYPPG